MHSAATFPCLLSSQPTNQPISGPLGQTLAPKAATEPRKLLVIGVMGSGVDTHVALAAPLAMFAPRVDGS